MIQHEPVHGRFGPENGRTTETGGELDEGPPPRSGRGAERRGGRRQGQAGRLPHASRRLIEPHHLARQRQFREPRQRPPHVLVVLGAQEVEQERERARVAPERTRFDARQVQLLVGEDAQHVEQRAGTVRRREDQRALPAAVACLALRARAPGTAWCWPGDLRCSPSRSRGRRAAPESALAMTAADCGRSAASQRAAPAVS